MTTRFNFILSAIASILLVSCSTQETVEADYGVIPLPQQVEVTEGRAFILSGSTKIVYPKDNTNLQRVAGFLSDYIRFATGKSLQVTDQEVEANCIVLQTSLEHTNKEAYQLEVNEQQILIKGASDAGTFYGVQTLRKSITADADKRDIAFPPVKIDDYPRFGYRGMMLDVGRHLFPLEFIKEYIDILALHNINRFHWHLTEDQGWRIEIKQYPELTVKGSQRKETVIGKNSGKFDGKPYGGFYTQEEAREIVAYARDRFITVVPEIDLPGHMLGALTAYPHLGCTGGPYETGTQWGVFDDVLCAGNEEVFTFLEGVLTEIVDIFPSEYIHIGGDECPKVRWKECPKCQARIKELGLKADAEHSKEDRLQSYVIARVEKFLNSKGRRIIGWDEILEGGLAPNATVMSWRGVEGAIAAAKLGHDAIMTPSSHLYFDHYQTTDVANVPLAIGGYSPVSKVYNFDPIPSKLTAEEAARIIGVQANLWTEYIPTTQQVEYMLMPRIDALAEVQWTMPEKKDYDQFLPRLFRMLKYYDKKGYNYAKTVFEINHKVEVNKEKGSLQLSLSTCDNAALYYTLDGSMPTDKSTRYTGTISLSEPLVVTAKAIRPQLEMPAYVQAFDINKATMKPVSLQPEPNHSYKYEGAPLLVNGVSGSPTNFRDGSWLGFNEGDVEILVDLETNTEFSQVEIGTFIQTGDWICGAEGLEVAVSDDGKTFRSIAKETFPALKEATKEVRTIKTTFDPVSARYVKAIITKTKLLPEWHPNAGKRAFLFIDEIKIN